VYAGVIVALFQWGWGQSLLGFTSVHSVASWLPLFLFVVLFGLSMDYHVFILSRIREAYDRTGHTDQAVTAGIKTTAGVFTAAGDQGRCVMDTIPVRRRRRGAAAAALGPGGRRVRCHRPRQGLLACLSAGQRP
jgi:MMPL family